MSLQSNNLRREAGKVLQNAKDTAEGMLKEAARLDSIYVPEPVYDDGTSLIMFSRQILIRGEVRTYYYAAVRNPANGNWMVTGTYAPPRGEFPTWDHLLEFIQGGSGGQRNPDVAWVIWHGELEELAVSKPEPQVRGDDVPSCGHAQASYSMPASSVAGQEGGGTSRISIDPNGPYMEAGRGHSRPLVTDDPRLGGH